MKNLTLIISVSLAYFGFGQDYPNPFKEIGKDVEILTLSNGEYDEFFPNDTIRRVGTVMFNTIEMKIDCFVSEEVIKAEAMPEGYLVSRWLSRDPLAAKYPSMSPYNFAGNNPVFFVDPDGGTIEPHGTAKADLNGDFDALLTTGNSTAMADLLKSTYDDKLNLYHVEDSKEFNKSFKKALKGLSKDQKALARGYAKAIRDADKYVVHGLSPDEDIVYDNFEFTPDQINAFKKSGGGEESMSMDMFNDKTGGGLTISGDDRISDPSVKAYIIYNNAPTELENVVDNKSPYDYSYGYPQYDEYGVAPTSAEVRAHEIIGHGVLSQFAMDVKGRTLMSIQVSNIVRKIQSFDVEGGKEYSPRTGTDHGNPLNIDYGPNLNDIPKELKK